MQSGLCKRTPAMESADRTRSSRFTGQTPASTALADASFAPAAVAQEKATVGESTTGNSGPSIPTRTNEPATQK